MLLDDANGREAERAKLAESRRSGFRARECSFRHSLWKSSFRGRRSICPFGFCRIVAGADIAPDLPTDRIIRATFTGGHFHVARMDRGYASGEDRGHARFMILGGLGGLDQALRLPAPRHEVVDTTHGMIGESCKDVGEVGLRIEAIELTGCDQCVDRGSTLGVAIGAGEGPIGAAERDAAQRPFRRVIRQTDASVLKQAREGGPASQAVSNRLGEFGARRQFRALRNEPDFELVDERPQSLLADGEPLGGGPTVDLALDCE
jgi:hypothetical protein